MLSNEFSQFSESLVNYLIDKDNFCDVEAKKSKLLIPKSDKEIASLDLTPFKASPQAVTANGFFSDVDNMEQLISAYDLAKSQTVNENSIKDAMQHVSNYADDFIGEIFRHAREQFSDIQARLVSRFVCNLDVYTAIKAVESLLNSRADLSLLEIAQRKSWDVHFDHLAIRCGSQANLAAEKIVQMLTQHHAYVASQVSGENYYQFSDGWNAYPLYKILANGQVLRLFIDQSDADHPHQIIQHWNHVYGYTSHHLAIRVTQLKDGKRQAISVHELIRELNKCNLNCMQATGLYTLGLLEQVFTQPEKNTSIPEMLKNEIVSLSPDLEKTIENAKLLELVSRCEMDPEQAKQYFQLYGLSYDAKNALHSAPIYQYFLPAQAAHVIRTSIQTG